MGNLNKYLGKRLDDRYEIRELIGIGGMADVYKAYDLAENKEVAVKILKEEYLTNEDFKRRFRNESKAIAVLSHPNIVKIFDVSFGDRVQFIVMEYVDGITLKEYIEQQKVVTWKEAVHFTVQILRALQHAHDNGIVHRDVKPQNVMLLQDGTVKVMDFGIARFARDNGRTISEKAIGSVHYISPEQARGDVTDEKTDIYSVGVLMFEMLTGRLPFDGDTPVSIAVKQMQEEAPKPRSINPDIPIGLEEIVVRAMKKDPDLRYQTASEMLRDIDEFKRNPNTVFEYKYFTEDGSTKYFDAVSDEQTEEEGEPKKKKKSSASMQVLMAVALACAIVMIAAVVLFMVGLKQSKDEFDMVNLVGLVYDDIKDDPKYDNIKIVVGEEKKSDTYDKGQIISQSPKEGTRVKEGAKVTVVVSSGLESTAIPSVSGQTKEVAKALLEEAGFKVSFQSEYNDDIEKDLVIRTDPAEGTVTKTGQTINVYLSSGKTPTVNVPNLVGHTEEEALKLLKDAGLKGQPSYVDSKKTKGTVLKQSVTGTAKKGATIPFEVSNGKAPKEKVPISIPFTGNPVNKNVTFSIYLDGVNVGTTTINPATAGAFTWTVEGSGKQQVVIKADGQQFAVVTVDFDNGRADMTSSDQSMIQAPASSSAPAPSSSAPAPTPTPTPTPSSTPSETPSSAPTIDWPLENRN